MYLDDLDKEPTHDQRLQKIFDDASYHEDGKTVLAGRFCAEAQNKSMTRLTMLDVKTNEIYSVRLNENDGDISKVAKFLAEKEVQAQDGTFAGARNPNKLEKALDKFALKISSKLPF